MRIGIDIDNTLVKTNEVLVNEALEFDKKFLKGKGIRDKYKYNFKEMFYWKELDVKNFFEWVFDHECIFNLDIVENASDITHKLHEDGHEIIIITYRQERENFDIYEKTKEMLENNNIYFDKLIVNSGDKGIVCKRENIDVFIDDSYSQCMDAINHGIKNVILFRTMYNKDSNLFSLDNWLDIYKYIKEVCNEKNS